MLCNQILTEVMKCQLFMFSRFPNVNLGVVVHVLISGNEILMKLKDWKQGNCYTRCAHNVALQLTGRIIVS